MQVCGKQPGNVDAREELIYANEVLMELRRREEDFELQLAGRAGLSEEELQVARCKRNLLVRGKDLPSDCTLEFTANPFPCARGSRPDRDDEDDVDEDYWN